MHILIDRITDNRIPSAGLRPLLPADADRLLAWRNSDRVRRHMRNDGIISPEEHRSWFGRVMEAADRRHFIFEIDGRAVGQVNFFNLSGRHGTAEWGVYIGETDAPRGSGLAMLFLGAKWFFQVKAFRRLCSSVIAGNDRSLSVHEKLGFEVEGCLREHVLRSDGFADIFLLANTSRRWAERSPLVALPSI